MQNNTTTLPQKQCTVCGMFLPATTEHFYRGSGAFGLRAKCKACYLSKCKDRYNNLTEGQREQRRQRDREAYWRNPEKIRARKRTLAAQHREKNRARSRAWYKNNRTHKSKYNAQYYNENRHRERARHQEWHRRNSRRQAQKWQEYRQKNPDTIYNRNTRRRAREFGANGTHTRNDIRELYRTSGGLCWWCGKEVGDNYEVDHRIPLAKGGSNAPENLCISCPECNRSKNANMPWDFNGRLL